MSLPTYGEWQATRFIGGGGNAEVWEVIHKRSGARRALKALLRQHLSDVETVARFKREAELGLRLKHPNIIEVYDADLNATPPYMICELATGDLTERLRKARLSVNDATGVMTKVAKALDYCYNTPEKIIHRDIKPQNILFVPISGSHEPKLSDFGIAHIQTGTKITQTGKGAQGSLPYMAPEQFRDFAHLDNRADVYSLGCVLYEMLTGSPPFQPDDPSITGIQIILEYQQKHEKQKPRPPSDINPQVTPRLDAIVLRSLEKKRENRYSSAGTFATQLELLGQLKKFCGKCGHANDPIAKHCGKCGHKLERAPPVPPISPIIVGICEIDGTSISAKYITCSLCESEGRNAMLCSKQCSQVHYLRRHCTECNRYLARGQEYAYCKRCETDGRTPQPRFCADKPECFEKHWNKRHCEEDGNYINIGDNYSYCTICGDPPRLCSDRCFDSHTRRVH